MDESSTTGVLSIALYCHCAVVAVFATTLEEVHATVQTLLLCLYAFNKISACNLHP